MNGADHPNASPLATLAPSRKPRLVYLDDELPIYEFILEHFADQFQFEKFTDGDAAWKHLLQSDPDALITDIKHPGLDGLDLLRRLAVKKVAYPILVITGYDDGSIQRFCKQSCPDLKLVVLEKPFVLGDILKYVAMVLDVYS